MLFFSFIWVFSLLTFLFTSLFAYFSFVLSNGAGQYERSFWSGTGKNRFLARRGYYSYPLSNGIYYTFFYTADDKGFHEDESRFI